MINSLPGQSRVIIENIQPQVDKGRYPVKRTVGETVQVTADIFSDGHDHVRAEVLYRKKTEKNWSLAEMHHLGNDSWAGSFLVTDKVPYVFTVRAWVDHFETWYDGILKKIEAQLQVQLELAEGSVLLLQLTEGKKKDIQKLSAQLKDETRYAENIELVSGEMFAELVKQNPLRRYEVVYPAELLVVVEHAKARFSTWYELFPRSASLAGKHGTFADVIKLLPRIEAMGFDVLYLPPIHPIGKVNRKGKNNNVRSVAGEPGSPWAIGSDEGGHKAIHPQLGTLEQYKELIVKARKRGIDVAMDLAFQCAPDHPYVTEHPDWFKIRPDGSIQFAENPPKKYQDIYPFNFECDDWQNLWNELLSVVLYWIDQGVKIFRVDNPHTKPFRFWQWLIAEVNKRHEDIIFLSEAFTRPKVMAALAKLGFTQSYTYFTWRVTRNELVEYMNELVHGPSRNYFRPNFWPNTPDILPYHLQHQGETIFVIRFVLAATLSSNYGIYGPPFEFCENNPIPGKEEYFNSEKFEIKQYDWKKTTRMTDIISIVNKARKNHQALQSTWNIYFCTCNNDNLLAYLKTTDDLTDCVLVVVNFDQHGRQSGYVQLPKEILRLTDRINVKLHDLVTDEHYTWTQEWNYVELDPNKLPFHLFHLTIHESFA
ncbi:MAG: alpha-1,4-glucan--maltose-1-phosphate maltosyltransferase [Cyclobacteriaceae bacterium]|nr:alpha-1,4-glucan--maltose-1-phosphate maltosyltransferase [Cyclobacteriaceae bacterium]